MYKIYVRMLHLASFVLIMDTDSFFIPRQFYV